MDEALVPGVDRYMIDVRAVVGEEQQVARTEGANPQGHGFTH
jgi:hypothetical protein